MHQAKEAGRSDARDLSGPAPVAARGQRLWHGVLPRRRAQHAAGPWLFFYDSFDPAGFISLDKPPVAFWIQTAFAAVLGYSGWTIHLPQALAGIASVVLLYRLARRAYGTAAGISPPFCWP